MEWGLRQLDQGLWVVNAENRAPGGLYMPLRTTLVETPMGLWVHSPVPFSDETANEMAKIAPVGALIAPNRLHHLHLPAAANRWKEARVFLAPGLAQKVTSLPAGETLTDGSSPWGQHLEAYAIEGCTGDLGNDLFSSAYRKPDRHGAPFSLDRCTRRLVADHAPSHRCIR